jgi:GNAT superfamily N-acetyltransferase
VDVPESPIRPTDWTVVPVTPERLDDVVTLFGPNGANSGCWCMWWRMPHKDWTALGKDGRRAAFTDVARSRAPVGLLGYAGDQPAGWAAVAPRSAYPRVLRSRTLGPADETEPGVWSVNCFFINRYHRRTGLGGALLAAAVDYAAEQGAGALEGYPVDTATGKRSSGDLYTGTVSQFTRAGFTEHARPPTGSRVIMRHPLASPSTT